MLKAVTARPREAADGPNLQPVGCAAVDRDAQRHDLHPFDWACRAALFDALVEPDEFQRIEVRRQDQQMIDVGSAEQSGQVIAAFGRERFELDEDNPQETLGIFREQFDRFDRGRRVASQPDRLRCERFARARVVAQAREERRDGIGRGQAGDVFLGEIDVGGARQNDSA